MDVNPIPGKVEIAIAVVGQRLFSGDNLPAAVVVGGRGPSWVVAGREEPVGAESDNIAELGGVHVARIGAARIGRGSLGERDRRAAGEQQKSECLEDARNHPDNYIATTMQVAGTDKQL